MRFRCRVCGWISDEDKQEQSFASLPESYLYPVCSAPKSAFAAIEESSALKGAPTVAEKLVSQLAGFGVERIYGIPGDSSLPLIEALASPKAALLHVPIDSEAMLLPTRSLQVRR